MNLKECFIAMHHLTRHDIETDDPTIPRRSDRHRLHQLGDGRMLRHIRLLQPLDGLRIESPEGELSLQSFGMQLQGLHFVLDFPDLPSRDDTASAEFFQAFERLLFQTRLGECLQEIQLDRTQLETVDLGQHISSRDLLAGQHKDLTYATFDLRRRQALADPSEARSCRESLRQRSGPSRERFLWDPW